MKRLLLLFSLLLPLLAGSGCNNTQLGPTLTEPAEVYDTCFVPKGHGDGTGISTSGHLAIVSVDIPARYAIVFKCQHGKFVIDGDRAQPLYDRLKRGDQVTIFYQTKYRVQNGATNAVGLHFVDAKLK